MVYWKVNFLWVEISQLNSWLSTRFLAAICVGDDTWQVGKVEQRHYVTDDETQAPIDASDVIAPGDVTTHVRGQVATYIGDELGQVERSVDDCVQ